MYWFDQKKIKTRNYICGYCGNDISSNVGYYTTEGEGFSRDIDEGCIYICHKCNNPTYINGNVQVPGAFYGKKFKEEIFGDDNIIFELYNEARNNMSVNAFTSVGLCCRKLLMHIAVNCGASENKRFIEYVDYLDNNGYIPINAKKWVDIIRGKGNEATHEIKLLNEDEAKTLLSFIEILITIIYELPYRADNI